MKGGRISKSSFIDDAKRKGYSEVKAEEIFELIFRTVKFSALKAHYPEEYMSSLLEIEKDNPDRYQWYLSEAKKMNVAVE